MTNDLYDRLLDYIEVQRSQIKLALVKDDTGHKDYLKGRLVALMDILSFLMTDGKLL